MSDRIPPHVPSSVERTEPAKPQNEAETVYLYRVDKESKLPVVIGKVFIDAAGDAWVRINKDDLAEGIGVTDIDGVALMTRGDFNAREPR